MTAADLPVLLRGAAMATGLAALPGWLLGLALDRLSAPRAAMLAALLLLPALLPLSPPGPLPVQALALLPWLALPLGWGLRRMPAGSRLVAATLAAPAVVLYRIWLPQIWPWLLAGLGLGFARALAAAVWPLLPALVHSPGGGG
jgi:ABC-type molybdate transport system permease subunit